MADDFWQGSKCGSLESVEDAIFCKRSRWREVSSSQTEPIFKIAVTVGSLHYKLVQPKTERESEERLSDEMVKVK